MRELGTIAPRPAGILADYLLARGIKTEIRPLVSKPDEVSIWVIDENRLNEARQVLERYTANPDDPDFTAAARKATAVRKEEARKEREYRKQYTDAGRVYGSGGSLRRTPVVTILIAGSVAMSLWTNFGKNFERIILYVNLTSFRLDPNDGFVFDSLDKALGPEPWRLIAPMFLHMSFLHLFFNMSWVSGLGGLIEREKGSWTLLGVVLVTHIFSAFSEYFWQVYGLHDKSIFFGGFSGAVYGLIGFTWAYGEYNPRGHLRLSGQAIQLSLIWMVLCFTGALGPVANGAHLGGLVAGLMVGYFLGLRDARRA
jgi:GlpG protein